MGSFSFLSVHKTVICLSYRLSRLSNIVIISNSEVPSVARLVDTKFVIGVIGL